MGFALPTLSSLSFLRLAQGIRLPAAAMEPAMRTIQPESPVQSEQATILSFSKARRRSQQRRSKSARLPEHRDAQLLLPLQPELPSLPADQALPSGLRIIQRSPQEQPECLFISGRMADVCAALERMEAHGTQTPA
ncbi:MULTISPECIES: hypothetical protein [Delftia]|uniref:hypothetical protein n=1 Tax=Delftia TaxID=80865 RepID=UPI00064034DB|nr:hypothetical protein [Delftia lacustris]